MNRIRKTYFYQLYLTPVKRSKKQIRISGQERIKAKLPEFIHKKVNFVLSDNTVHFGELAEVAQTMVVLVNMRQKKIKLPLEKVIEFFSDIDA